MINIVSSFSLLYLTEMEILNCVYSNLRNFLNYLKHLSDFPDF